MIFQMKFKQLEYKITLIKVLTIHKRAEEIIMTGEVDFIIRNIQT